ncbi:hypothetical protein PYW08_013832 [Mythimna loreyi]|uniref:Uncharacterized protein n=1 Tax=Mythimna loreyi TaxID=667449 RepID=A0ACC2RA37_9NEOP|nr:hypothetical protein PYW08_013832 [Mythimna loreyi]
MNELKSIRCKFLSILTFLIIFTCTSGVVAYEKPSYRDIIADFPKAKDFNRYLSALEKVVDFCVRHKHYVDLNMQFGLFLIDVNLRRTLQEKSVPAKARSRLENLFEKNDELSSYFHSMVQKNQNVTKMGQDIKLTLLFYNASTWPVPADKFNRKLLKRTKLYNSKQLNIIYGKWENYFKNVNNFEKNYPSPKESDACLAHLVRTPHLPWNRRFLPNCQTPRNCKLMIEEGSDFGYALTHRLLFLVIARFSRSCVVFSEKEDQLKTDTFCKKCFYEAEYIASNNFQFPDLIYEQICLCGLFGHTQFIRNYWLKTLLDFQTSEGCFSAKIGTEDFEENEMKDDEDDWKIDRVLDIMNGQCNGHFSSVAVATLSNALRYILETYY